MPSFSRIIRLIVLLAVVSFVPACNSLNPLCSSARPAPVLKSISPTTMTFSQLPPSFTLTATGSSFVSSSVVVFNGANLPTTVVSSSQLTVAVTPAMIPAAGSFPVSVNTPAGTSGDLGCSSGGTSSSQTLTVN
jgi:IPT/TIG domain